MGLDMYLYATPKGSGPDKYVKEEEFARIMDSFPEGTAWEKRWAAVQLPGVIELGYWRKQNAIHQWFVENVQDGIDECEPHRVHPEVLADLHHKCSAILEDPTNEQLAHELLPTRAGFFFGSTEYDDWYLQGVKETVEFLEKALNEARGMDVYYQSSW